MSKVLIIGCGGVASVAISKCCQISDVFTDICIASRTVSKCEALAARLAPATKTKITTRQVDADKLEELVALIKDYQPDLVMNIALPYQDLTIMDACLACGVNHRSGLAGQLRKTLPGKGILCLLRLFLAVGISGKIQGRRSDRPLRLRL